MKSIYAILILSLTCFASQLEKDFQNPPPGYGTQAWWHWTSRFVTKKGITADLEAMAKVGIEVAHIFCASATPTPPGQHPQMLTDEWKEIFRHAGEEARRLGIKLGVHNCPGWSSSGGPWITPENSMQYVVASETNVMGSQTVTTKLRQPFTQHNHYRDIEVLAFPNPNTQLVPKVKLLFETNEKPEFVADNDPDTKILLRTQKPGDESIVLFEFPESITASFLELKFANSSLYIKGFVETSSDGTNFQNAASFNFELYNDQQAPKHIQLNVKSPFRACKVTFQNRPRPPWGGKPDTYLIDARLLASPMIPNINARNSAGTNFSYKPFPDSYTEKGIQVKDIIRLTDKLQNDGTITAKLPEGQWTILRIGHTTTGKRNAPAYLSGLECDKLSRRGLDAHWPHSMTQFSNTLKGLDVLKFSTIDSYEVGGQNWTPGLQDEFRKRRGYDIVNFLPAVLGYVVDTPQISAKFLFDFQRTIAELFAENYFDYFTELCHRDGITAITEAYGGPFASIRCSRTVDIACTEFWIGGGPPGKLPSYVANVQGNKKVGAEAFTTDAKPGRWQQDPAQLKEYGDNAWASGINQLILHSYVHQPWLNVKPGLSLGRHGSMLNRHTTWWDDAKPWLDYIKRSQFLLQQGKTTAEFLVLAPEANPNSLPNIQQLDKAGLGYDYCCVEDLYDSIATTQDGKLKTPSGATYYALFLGNNSVITTKTLEKILQLAQDGATIIGTKPIDSPSLDHNDQSFKSLIEKLWHDAKLNESRTIGKGRLINTNNPVQALQIKPTIDPVFGIKSIKRRLEDETLIVWLANTQDAYITKKLAFNLPNTSSPQIWNPENASIMPPTTAIHEDGKLIIPLEFKPLQSLFIVFKNQQPNNIPFENVATAAANQEPDEGITISKAIYRDREDHAIQKDVTEILKKLVADNELNFPVSNATLGGDISPNRYKELVIHFNSNGKTFEKIAPEHHDFHFNLSARTRQKTIRPTWHNNAPAIEFEQPGSATCRMSDKSTKTVTVNDVPAPINLDDTWTVNFPPNLGAPSSITLDKLIDLATHDNPGVKFFSGTATYTKKFAFDKQLSPNARYILDLGNVKNLAKIKLNDAVPILLWHPPFTLDITDFLKAGENTLAIQITNLWPNRLIGDAMNTTPVPTTGSWPSWVIDDKPTSPAGHITFVTWRDGWNKDDIPLPSGLIGPVAIKTAILKTIP